MGFQFRQPNSMQNPLSEPGSLACALKRWPGMGNADTRQSLVKRTSCGLESNMPFATILIDSLYQEDHGKRRSREDGGILSV